MDENLRILNNEKSTLKKLLYRNKNQHRSTLLHKHLTGVYQVLHQLTLQSNSIISVNNQFESSIKGLHKPTSQIVKDSLNCLIGLSRITSLSSELTKRCIVPSIIAKSHISQLLFLSLYSVYLALLSTIFKISSIISIHHYKNLQILHSSLQSCATLYTKYKPTIEAILIQYSLSEESNSFILDLINASSNSTSELKTDTTTKSSSSFRLSASSSAISSSTTPIGETLLTTSSSLTMKTVVEDCGESILSTMESNVKFLPKVNAIFTPTTQSSLMIDIKSSLSFNSDESDESDESDLDIDQQQLFYHSTPTVTPLKDLTTQSNSQRQQFSQSSLSSPFIEKPLPTVETIPDISTLKSSSSPFPSSSSLSSSSPTTVLRQESVRKNQHPPLVPPTTPTVITSSSIKRKQQELFQQQDEGSNNNNNNKNKNNSNEKGNRKMKRKKKLNDIDDIFGDL